MANYGYDGTLDEVAYAKAIMLGGGTPYAVTGAGDFQASIGGAGDRAVTISAGEAVGKGVRSTLAQAVLNLPSVSSGSRWDLLAIRRDWNANTSALVRVGGGPNPVIPARQVAAAEPWIQDDQPLWLARVLAGQSAVQELIDLRVWVAAGGATAADKLALTYLDTLGTQIMIGGVLYVRAIGSNGTAEWKRWDLTDTGWVDGVVDGGWDSPFFKFRRIGAVVYYRIAVQRPAGWGVNFSIGVIPLGFRPAEYHYTPNTDSNAGIGAGKDFRFDPDGTIHATHNWDSSSYGGVTLTGSYPLG